MDEIASCDLWVRERVVICKLYDEIRRTSNEFIFAKYLFHIVQHISALIMGHNQAHVRIYNKIAIAHNPLLLN